MRLDHLLSKESFRRTFEFFLSLRITYAADNKKFKISSETVTNGSKRIAEQSYWSIKKNVLFTFECTKDGHSNKKEIVGKEEGPQTCWQDGEGL